MDLQGVSTPVSHQVKTRNASPSPHRAGGSVRVPVKAKSCVKESCEQTVELGNAEDTPRTQGNPHGGHGAAGRTLSPTRTQRLPGNQGLSTANSPSAPLARSYNNVQTNDKLQQENKEAIEEILNESSNNMTLIEFIATISPYTKDTGSLLRKVLGDELHSFRNFIGKVFEGHVQDVSELLAQEQATLKDKYRQWTKMIVHRLRRVSKVLEHLVPNFDWNAYRQNGDDYIRKLFYTNTLDEEFVDMREEEDYSEWRKEHFLKLLFLEDETKKLQADNEDLMSALDSVRRQKHNRQSNQSQHEQLLHKKNFALQNKARALRDRRNEVSNMINELFLKYEANQMN